MQRINQLEISIHHSDEDLEKKILKTLRIKKEELISFEIVRRSIDARNKKAIKYSYTINVCVKDENRIDQTHTEKYEQITYKLPESGSYHIKNRPVIIGAGPAGLFAGLVLAKKGYNPLIIERGEPAYERKKAVDRFWETGVLDTSSNVSFGEGGAGTFSDGKLNTAVKDISGRNTEVLKTFVEHGADKSVLYEQKPHIGTDKLIEIITSIRKEIVRLGGEVVFRTALTDIYIEDGKIKDLLLSDGRMIRTDILVLAIGHSARDTFEMLKKRNIPMEQKAFAVGLRIQHPQNMIDISQFGEAEAGFLSPASYKLTGRASNGRGVYSFCMCPGGYVVDASTEDGLKAINGMSYHLRDSGTANSAIVVTVSPDDFGADDILAGVEYQRELEKLAYRYGNGSIPVQLLGDFINRKESRDFGDVCPKFKGSVQFARLDDMLPGYIYDSIKELVPEFDRKIKDFGRYDSVLAGIESRTSSPVRILRNEALTSEIEGLYPCGEGAGYAGGITSAAMDGLRVAEEIIRKYRTE